MSAEKLENRPIKEFPPKQFGSGGEAVFDNRVHIRDENSGRLVKKQPYATHKFGGKTIYERPIGSRNMFDHDGKSLGVWKPLEGGAWEQISKEHKEAPSYELVLSQDDLAQRNSELEAELAALKADMELKASPAPKQGKA